MTNKKKQSKTASSVAKKTNTNDASTPTPTKPEQTKGLFTPPQLTGLVMLAMGASRYWEVQSAVEQMAAPGANELCQSYFQDNYRQICDTPAASTVLQLHSHAFLQLLVLVGWLILQCWMDESTFCRLNTVIAIAPASTTLMWLQANAKYLVTTKSRSLTFLAATVVALCGSQVQVVVQQFKYGLVKRVAPKITSLPSLCLIMTAAVQLMELVQWHTTSNGSNDILSSSLVHPNQNDAMAVFTSALVFDKMACAALMMCSWYCFDDYKQRSFLMCWAGLKAYEYFRQLPGLDQSHFSHFDTLAYSSLACGIAALVASAVPDSTSSSKVKAA